MNKQELIERLKSDLTAMSEIKGKKFEYDRGYERAIKEHLAMISYLDWPENPVVPQYVAEFIASEQRSCSTLSEAIDNMDMMDDRGVTSWFYDNSEIFAKAWLYGYEVEKEKLYTVEIPNPNGGERPILYKKRDGKVSIIFASNPCWRTVKDAQLTESEIKEYFGWAWKFAKEVKE